MNNHQVIDLIRRVHFECRTLIPGRLKLKSQPYHVLAAVLAEEGVNFSGHQFSARVYKC